MEIIESVAENTNHVVKYHAGDMQKIQKKDVVAKGRKDMKIAVTYENGEIFQHFGHTKQFKVYEVENGVITKSKVMDSNGSGHQALWWSVR